MKILKRITATIATIALMVSSLMIFTSTAEASGLSTYGGVNYSLVYDYDYYIAHNPDVKAAFGADQTATLGHFVTFGMREGRQASSNFNVGTYKGNYTDLQRAFGGNLQSYYLHYITNGYREGRKAAGTTTQATPSIGSYSLVYDYNYYINKYADLKAAFGTNQSAAFNHFVNHGMSEGRQASPNFNVSVYKANYVDLQRAFGNNLKSYYDHYVNNGYREGRKAVSSVVNNNTNTNNTANNASTDNNTNNNTSSNPSTPSTTPTQQQTYCEQYGHKWQLHEEVKVITLGEKHSGGARCGGCGREFRYEDYESQEATADAWSAHHRTCTSGIGSLSEKVDPSTVEYHSWKECTKCGTITDNKTEIINNWTFNKTDYIDRYHLKYDISKPIVFQ